MKKALFFLLFLLLLVAAQAQQEIPLYQGDIPNALKVADPERVVKRGENNRAIFDTAIPTLTIFTPKRANGKAVIICPGGGYVKTAFDKEGTLIAKELQEVGITAFVLKYRIPQDLTNVDKSLAPLQDAQQAIRFVRKNADKYKLSSDQIGIMGFSAGGHLAASAATHFNENKINTNTDSISLRPDFVVLVYPVISFTDALTHNGSRTQLIGEKPSEEAITYWSNEAQVIAESPPAFLVHAADDKAVSVKNSLAYYTACIDNDVPAEMHLYPKGGHGFGLNNPTTKDAWMDRLKTWLEVDAIIPVEKEFNIENCVNQFDKNKAILTKVGYQYWFVNKHFLDGRTLKMSVVEPHQATHPPHRHEGDEFFYVLEGTAEFHLNGETTNGGAHTSFYCPPNSIHGIRNVGDTTLKYLVIKKYKMD